jgi:hypothetical protein
MSEGIAVAFVAFLVNGLVIPTIAYIFIITKKLEY